MKPYLYGSMLLAVLAAFYMTYNAGKHAVVAELQNDRIEVLKDGKKIDEGVFAADDPTLYCLLVNCKSN